MCLYFSIKMVPLRHHLIKGSKNQWSKKKKEIGTVRNFIGSFFCCCQNETFFCCWSASDGRHLSLLGHVLLRRDQVDPASRLPGDVQRPLDENLEVSKTLAKFSLRFVLIKHSSLHLLAALTFWWYLAKTFVADCICKIPCRSTKWVLSQLSTN